MSTEHGRWPADDERNVDAADELAEHDSKECPMCGGSGRIYNITEAMNKVIGEGAAMVVPLSKEAPDEH